MGTEGRAGSHTLHPLTKKDLDLCLQRVAEELAQAAEPGPQRPRWIEPAELIRRVAPFLGRN